MDNNTTTYKEMYEGEVVVYPTNHTQERFKDFFCTFFFNDIALNIERTNKLAQDKPTLTWHIPLEKLGVQSISMFAADYCLRAFSPYIDKLNAQLYNRSRPDNENGEYYIKRGHDTTSLRVRGPIPFQV